MLILCSFISTVYATLQQYTSDKMGKRLKGACGKNKERKAMALLAISSEKAVAAIAKATGVSVAPPPPLNADVASGQKNLEGRAGKTG